MKKQYIILLAAATGMALSSCNDFLDKPELDKMENNPQYWNNESNLQAQTNRLYNNFSGYGGQTGSFYFDALNDDQADPSFADWNTRVVPGASSTYNNPYIEIRGCNYIITNVRNTTLSTEVKNKYEGIAKFNRAYQFYSLVRHYGDVQWVSDPLATNQTDIIYGPRTDRHIVVDSILRDLDYAIATIGKGSSKSNWSSDAALALKADVCLFEGTFCRYRTKADNNLEPNEERAVKYLNEAVKAAEAILNAGYTLNPAYGTIYNSIDLSGNSEVIFFKPYSQPEASFGHGTCAYTNSTSTMKGINKLAFDAFLFRDGEAKANTTLDTNDEAAADGSIQHLLDVRDKRLGVIIDPFVGFGGHEGSRYEGCPTLTSSTGYTIRKFYTDALLSVSDGKINDYYLKTIGQNYTSAPIFYLAPVMLAYAEAKAELGSLSKTDLDLTVNKLLDRAGLPAMTMSPKHDPANNHGVSDLLWEIRRCRRCELMLDNFRYWDLVRWHQLDKLDTEKYPELFYGANVTNVPDIKPDLVTVTNGYIHSTPNAKRVYEYKYYLDPIPSGQISLNENLGQNYGWK